MLRGWGVLAAGSLLFVVILFMATDWAMKATAPVEDEPYVDATLRSAIKDPVTSVQSKRLPSPGDQNEETRFTPAAPAPPEEGPALAQDDPSNAPRPYPVERPQANRLAATAAPPVPLETSPRPLPEEPVMMPEVVAKSEPQLQPLPDSQASAVEPEP